MFRVKKEQGYALVSVLLIIVIFMILILSFMGQSFNSVSQNKVVEKKSESVALAEMGITYYQTAVKNSYNANQSIVDGPILDAINNQINNKVKETADQFVQDAAKSMLAHIQTDFTNVPIEKDFGSDASFKLLDPVTTIFASNPITLRVQGTADGKSSILTTVMTLNPTVSGVDGSVGTQSGISLSLSISDLISGLDSIKNPANLSSPCNNATSIIPTCNQMVIGTNVINDNDNNLGGTTSSPIVIYSSSSSGLTINGNLNSLNYVNIHTEGDLSLSKNMNSASNAILESKNATFGSNVGLVSSNLFANGNLNVYGKFDLSSKSFAVINGNATISNHLDISADSKLCISGDLTASMLKSSKITGSLIVEGKINGSNANSVTSDVFQQRCSSLNPHTPTIEWGDQISNTVNYQY